MSFGDFFGGAAEAGAGIIGRNIQAQQSLDNGKQLADYQSELEVKRQEVIDALRSRTAESARVQQVNTIDGRLEQNADADIAQRYADPVMGGTPMTTCPN